jgi:amino acid adenylation domain-containing protein
MRQEIINGFRLSPHQQRLWLIQQDSQAYRAQCALLLEGYLKIEVLKEALHKIVRRHEILRTTFQSLPGMKVPVQVVADDSVLLLHHINLSDLGTQEQEAKIEELFQETRRQPFNFEQGPLLRFSLLTLSTNKHVLLVSLPSLCADAWTLKNLVREISQSYEACLKDEEHFDELLQYVQFAEWQNELLLEEDAEAGKEYWRKRNLSPIPAFRLPFEKEQAEKTSFEPASLALEISSESVEKIETIANEHSTSVATFLLACWQALLWRLTGQTDIVVGDACDGRQHEMLYNALGLFTRWVPIHCHFEGDLRFSELLSQITAARHNACEWQDYFVWDEVGLAGDDSVVPFFPVGFEFEKQALPCRADDISISVYKQYVCTECFNIKLSCRQTNDSLTAEFHYHPGRFQIEDIRRLARHFDTLLKSAIENVDTLVSELEVLSQVDQDQLLIEFNNTDANYPADQCIHQLFEEQVACTPDKLAVVFREQQLSYAQLNARANQLAHYLRKLGVGPEVVVGLCFERSVEMVIGILGVLKAGGAYVPLDPTYPKERVAFILAEAKAPVLLTQERLKDHLPEQAARVVAIDVDWILIAQESDENPISEVTADNLAYVIYTSGSTGKPKGVMIQHRSAANLVAGLQRAIYVQHPAHLRVSLNAPLTFDASVKQWLQLLQGHTLVILPEEVRPEGDQLLSFVRQQAIDVLDCTPAQLRLLLVAGLTQNSGMSPRAVLAGGEAIDEASWAFLAEQATIEFYNVYGPTECTVDATVCPVRESPLEPAIGRPIANAQTYLLDEKLRPVPIGVAGELYIGGAGLSRGYLSRPDLTAERFIPHPFSAEPGARLYKTGDLACYLSDGKIKFLGRADYQVKLRGFRIELGEIEAVLGQHPAIKDKVVIVREDVAGDSRLVAYFVPRQKLAPGVDELRRFLREQLPEYMVPSAFVALEELPLTRHGKVDRQALPLPESQRPELQENYLAPRNNLEEAIAAIWQEVLRVDKVGVNDNFFDLGGHSLLMVQVHSKLRENFSKDISLIEMFRNPTISSLARYFSEEQSQQPALQKAHERAQKRREARKQQMEIRQTRRQFQ